MAFYCLGCSARVLTVPPTKPEALLSLISTWESVTTRGGTWGPGTDEGCATTRTRVGLVTPLGETILMKYVKTTGRETLIERDVIFAYGTLHITLFTHHSMPRRCHLPSSSQ